MIKKGLLLVAALTCLVNAPLQAYRYRVANLTNDTLFIDLRGAAKGTLFVGDKGASDSWKIKDYDSIPAKGTKDYSFVGIYCIDAIRVGKSVTDLSPTPIQKAPGDVAAFNATVEKITVVSNTAKDLIGKIPKLGDALKTIADSLTDYINPVAGIVSNWLCFDMTFFIGENPYKAANEYGGLYNYVVIAQQGITDTSKFTGMTANLNKPESLPNTPFWQRIYDDIVPAAKKQITRGVEAAGGAEKVKSAAKDALFGKK